MTRVRAHNAERLEEPSRIDPDDKRVDALLRVPLTDPARVARFRPLIGRENEFDALLTGLRLLDKPHVLLLGEPGVGKTALVEELARRIAGGALPELNVPGSSTPRRVHSLNLASMLNKYVGGMEHLLLAILERAERDALILFLDECHELMHVGGGENSVPAKDILKPFTDRPSPRLRILGATTLSEFHSNLAADKALMRRFSRITLLPPSATETLTIVRAAHRRYQDEHHVLYDDVLQAVVSTAKDRLPGHFPDKALALLDIVGAMQRHAAADSSIVTQDDVDAALIRIPADSSARPVDPPAIVQALTAARARIEDKTTDGYHPDKRVHCPDHTIERLAALALGDLDRAQRALVKVYEAADRRQPNYRRLTLQDVERGVGRMLSEPTPMADVIVKAARSNLRPLVQAARLIVDTIEDLFEKRVGSSWEATPGIDENTVVARATRIREHLPGLLGHPDQALTLSQKFMWERAEKELDDLNVHFLFYLVQETLTRRQRYVKDGGEMRTLKGAVFTTLFYSYRSFTDRSFAWRGIPLKDLAAVTCTEFEDELHARP